MLRHITPGLFAIRYTRSADEQWRSGVLQQEDEKHAGELWNTTPDQLGLQSTCKLPRRGGREVDEKTDDGQHQLGRQPEEREDVGGTKPVQKHAGQGHDEVSGGDGVWQADERYAANK